MVLLGIDLASQYSKSTDLTVLFPLCTGDPGLYSCQLQSTLTVFCYPLHPLYSFIFLGFSLYSFASNCLSLLLSRFFLFFLTYTILCFTFPLFFDLPCFSFLSPTPVASSLYSPLSISSILSSLLILEMCQRSLQKAFDTVACHPARNQFQLQFCDCTLMTRVT